MDLINVLDVGNLVEVPVLPPNFVPRANGDRFDPFVAYDDAKFKERYRFRKDTVRKLVHPLSDNLKRPTNRSNAVSPETQVGIVDSIHCSLLCGVSTGSGWGGGGVTCLEFCCWWFLV